MEAAHQVALVNCIYDLRQLQNKPNLSGREIQHIADILERILLEVSEKTK